MGFLFPKYVKQSMMGTLDFVPLFSFFSKKQGVFVLSLDDCL